MCKSWRLSLVWQQGPIDRTWHFARGRFVVRMGESKRYSCQRVDLPKKNMMHFWFKTTLKHKISWHTPWRTGWNPRKNGWEWGFPMKSLNKLRLLPGRQMDSHNLQTSVTFFKGLAAAKWPPPLCWLVGVVKNASPIFLRVGDGRSI